MKALYFTINILIIVCFTVSCNTVRIDSLHLPTEVKKLELTNRKKINLETQSDNAFSPAGHQYLFVILPFGRIEVMHPETSIYNKAATKLALLGYNISKEKSVKGGTLRISLNNLQLTAYDLFFIRRLYCEIELTLEVFDSSQKLKSSKYGKAVKSTYKAFGFKPQLEHIYTQCLDEAINQVLIDIY